MGDWGLGRTVGMKKEKCKRRKYELGSMRFSMVGVKECVGN
jgi:hypothetical protein